MLIVGEVFLVSKRNNEWAVRIDTHPAVSVKIECKNMQAAKELQETIVRCAKAMQFALFVLANEMAKIHGVAIN